MVKVNRPPLVTLKVARNRTNTHTLVEYLPGEPIPRDLGGALFLNSDKAEFYRAVAKEIAKRAARGEKVVYHDLPDP